MANGITASGSQATDRRTIPSGSAGSCAICKALRVSTGSLFEWKCPILPDSVCETHCAEVQLQSGTETRKAAATVIGSSANPDELIRVCNQCPHGDIARAAGAWLL